MNWNNWAPGIMNMPKINENVNSLFGRMTNPLNQQNGLSTQGQNGLQETVQSEIPVVNKIMQKAATPAPQPMSDIPSVDQTLQKAQKMGGMSFMSQPKAYNAQPQQAANYESPFGPAQQPSFWDKTKGFLGSPLGGSLLTTGLVGGLTAAFGGSPLEALSYGAQGGGRASEVYQKRKQEEAENQVKQRYFDNQLVQKEMDRIQHLADQNFEVEKIKLQNQENMLRDQKKPLSMNDMSTLMEIQKRLNEQNGIVPGALYPTTPPNGEYGKPIEGGKAF